MKDLTESQETFAAYATIDAGYYMLKELQKGNRKTLSAIESAIDKATGYDGGLKEVIASAILILKDIIKAKVFIEADFTGDQKMLDELQGLLSAAKRVDTNK